MSYLCGVLSMDIQTLLVFLAVFLLVFNYAQKQSWKNLPPGPPCLPIVGSLPFLSSRDLRHSMKTLQKKYGDVFTVHMGLARVVVIASFDAIKEALRTRGEAFGARPEIYVVQEISNNMGILGTYGRVWKEQKRFTLNVLRSFGLGKSLLEERIREEARHMLKELDDLNGRPLNPQHLFMCMPYNIIGTLISGKRMDYHSKELKKILAEWKVGIELSGRVNSLLVPFPFLKYLPWDLTPAAKLQRHIVEIRKNHYKSIEEHREKLSMSAEPKDLIDAYLMMIEQEKDNEESSFTEAQMLHIIDDLYAAGTGTTSTTLCWAMIHLLNHPQVVHRCQEEIDATLGGSRKLPSMKDRLSMPYTQATLLEIQRMADLVPFNLPHGTAEDVEFRGYHIPRGTIIFTNLNSLFKDETCFPNSDKFDPERFLNEDGSVKRIEQMIPFSMGPRLCLGEGLARMELFIFLTALLQDYTPTMPAGHQPPSMSGTFFITHDPHPFQVSFVKRK